MFWGIKVSESLVLIINLNFLEIVDIVLSPDGELAHFNVKYKGHGLLHVV